jgi:hypothetical protein
MTLMMQLMMGFKKKNLPNESNKEEEEDVVVALILPGRCCRRYPVIRIVILVRSFDQ